MQCKQCGSVLPFESRLDRQFCDATCRKAWSRRKQAAKRSNERIISELGNMRRQLKERPDLRPGINENLKFIRDEVTFLLRMYDELTKQEEAEKFQLLANRQFHRIK